MTLKTGQILGFLRTKIPEGRNENDDHSVDDGKTRHDGDAHKPKPEEHVDLRKETIYVLCNDCQDEGG